MCHVVQNRRQLRQIRATLRHVDRTASAERPTDRPSVPVCLRTSAALPAAGLNALSVPSVLPILPVSVRNARTPALERVDRTLDAK